MIWGNRGPGRDLDPALKRGERQLLPPGGSSGGRRRGTSDERSCTLSRTYTSSHLCCAATQRQQGQGEGPSHDVRRRLPALHQASSLHENNSSCNSYIIACKLSQLASGVWPNEAACLLAGCSVLFLLITAIDVD